MRYSLKFALWLALAALAPLAGAGYYTLSTLEKSVRAGEQERFRLAGREMVFRLEKRGAADVRGGVDPLPAMSDELRSAAEYLHAGAALVTREGRVAVETGDAWGGAKDDLIAAAIAGDGPKSTVVFPRPCGRLCERYAAVSPIMNTPYNLVFSLSPGRAMADLERLVAEWVIAGIVALFCALAVGLHVAGPLNAALRELRDGARQYKKGNFLHVIAKGPPGDLAAVIDEFNDAARETHVRLHKAEARSAGGYSEYEKLAKNAERLAERVAVLAHLAGVARELDGMALAKKIVSVFEMDLRAEGKSAVTTGNAEGWPEGLSMHRALYFALDAARPAGKADFSLDLSKNGFSVGFEPAGDGRSPGALKTAINLPEVETRVESAGNRTTIAVYGKTKPRGTTTTPPSDM